MKDQWKKRERFVKKLEKLIKEYENDVNFHIEAKREPIETTSLSDSTPSCLLKGYFEIWIYVPLKIQKIILSNAEIPSNTELPKSPEHYSGT